MKVIRLTPDFFYKPENRFKGLSSHMYNMISEFKKLRVDHDIITLRSDIKYADGINVYLVKEKRPFNVIRTGIDSYKLIKNLNLKADIIHTHQYSFFSLYHFKSKLKVPLIHTIHSTPFSKDKLVVNFQKPKYRDELYNYHFNKYACKRADKITVKSNEIRNDVINKFNINPKKIYTVPAGVNTNFFIRERKIKNIDILFVGRFVPLKSLLVLLKAILLIKKDYPNIKVYFVGGQKTDSDYNMVCDFIQHNNLTKNITLIGPLAQSEVLDYYNRSKVFVLSSYAEATGQVILEAMSCEVPVVVSSAGGIVDNLIDYKHGLLFNYPNHIELSEKIKIVLEDTKLAKKLAKSAKEMVINKYEWSVLTKKIYDIYSEVL